MSKAISAFLRTGAIIVFCCLIIAWFSCPNDAGATAHISTSLNSYQVADLEASMQGNTNLLVVSGNIKNTSFQPLKGAAVIYLLDSSGAVVQGVEVEVNNGHRFYHGQNGYFEKSINISRFSNLQQVIVEFVEYSTGTL